MADTMATVELFEKILAKQNGASETKDLINRGLYTVENVKADMKHLNRGLAERAQARG